MSIKELKEKALEGDSYYRYELAGELAEAGNYTEALYWYTLSAQQGYRYAQLELGCWYDAGKPGIEKNQKKAVKWAKRAARQDHEQAQEWLGNHYWSDSSDTYRLERAMYWYTRAASRGSAIAHEWLADRYKENPKKWARSMLDNTTDQWDVDFYGE